MNIDLADVLVHVDETLNESEIAELDDAFRSSDGIVSVHVEKTRPHLFVLEYNPARIHSTEVLNVAKSRGMHAELVGM